MHPNTHVCSLTMPHRISNPFSSAVVHQQGGGALNVIGCPRRRCDQNLSLNAAMCHKLPQRRHKTHVLQHLGVDSTNCGPQRLQRPSRVQFRLLNGFRRGLAGTIHTEFQRGDIQLQRSQILLHTIVQLPLNAPTLAGECINQNLAGTLNLLHLLLSGQVRCGGDIH